ncbi:MAG TPA: acyl-CoA dehydrogenase family protein [Acidimicrobiales bacterium]|nr:acyl-CoA dehydrogenase family protein [Acidimicrobiales bacterium]
MEIEAFAAAARAFLQARRDAGTLPPDWGAILPGEMTGIGRRWQADLYDAGFAAIDWPVEFGGRGLSGDHVVAWRSAAAEFEAPSVLNMVGLVLTAGALLSFGTREQQAQHLPPTARGERVWCQMFSEPDAGSDLAALTTKAERDGDVWRINGRKVWTSAGYAADWGILLARTKSLQDAPKHEGISFFVVDMHTPGLATRPLRQMTGSAEFDEVTLDDVAVPADALLGPEHAGWNVAMGALTRERGFIGGGAKAMQRRLEAVIRHPGGSAAIRDRRIAAYVEGRTLDLLTQRQGPAASVASSLAKLGLAELAMELAAVRATDAAAMLLGPQSDAVVGSPGARLGGGTSEVQRNIIGERLLGLPREPRP